MGAALQAKLNELGKAAFKTPNTPSWRIGKPQDRLVGRHGRSPRRVRHVESTGLAQGRRLGIKGAFRRAPPFSGRFVGAHVQMRLVHPIVDGSREVPGDRQASEDQATPRSEIYLAPSVPGGAG
jgi:hypothetical protein